MLDLGHLPSHLLRVPFHSAGVRMPQNPNGTHWSPSRLRGPVSSLNLVLMGVFTPRNQQTVQLRGRPPSQGLVSGVYHVRNSHTLKWFIFKITFLWKITFSKKTRMTFYRLSNLFDVWFHRRGLDSYPAAFRCCDTFWRESGLTGIRDLEEGGVCNNFQITVVLLCIHPDWQAA